MRKHINTRPLRPLRPVRQKYDLSVCIAWACATVICASFWFSMIYLFLHWGTQ